MLKINVEITKIFYPKQVKTTTAGDFCIFAAKVLNIKEGATEKILTKGDTITIKGIVPPFAIGDIITIVIKSIEKNKYGTTFILDTVCREVDLSDEKDLKTFYELICGKKIAKELIKIEGAYHYLINRNDEELLKVKGIGTIKLNIIYNKLEQYADYTAAYIKLEPFGLSKTQIRKICKAFGGAREGIEACLNSPYSLIDKVEGISFKTADDIALKCSCANKIEIRLRYAILYLLELNAELGKSFLTFNQFLKEINNLMSVEFETIQLIVENLIKEKIIIISSNGDKIALRKYYDLELEILHQLDRIDQANSSIKIDKNYMSIIKKLEKKQSWCYTVEQIEGIKSLLFNNVCFLNGKAGTGKTTVIKAVYEILKEYELAMCCLAARAAQRLSEVTSFNASTIHKLLSFSTPETPLNYDIIVVDESSMVNGTLFLRLLKSISNGTKLIIIGDEGQLTSIGNCNVFADLLHSNRFKVVTLNEIHRQAKKSAIITISKAIREQKRILPANFTGKKTLGELQDLTVNILKDRENICEETISTFFKSLDENDNNILETQIIVAMKERGGLSCLSLNKIIQEKLGKVKGKCFTGFLNQKIYVGDKVINTKNNYKTLNLKGENVPFFNGSIGMVKSIEDDFAIIDFTGIGEIVVTSDLFKRINLAYAITVHSSQGSQWNYIITALDMSNYILLNVEMLYTAITRAVNRCNLIIEKTAFNRATTTVEQKTKQTFLSLLT